MVHRSIRCLVLLGGLCGCGSRNSTPPHGEVITYNPPYFVSVPPQDPVRIGSTWEYQPVVRAWNGGPEDFFLSFSSFSRRSMRSLNFLIMPST